MPSRVGEGWGLLTAAFGSLDCFSLPAFGFFGKEAGFILFCVLQVFLELGIAPGRRLRRSSAMMGLNVLIGLCLSSFKNNRGETLSYGQAQKPLNVFLKVYVDWAKQPTRELADKLAPLLHVPLDSLLMGFIAEKFANEYQSRIATLRKRHVAWIAERLQATPSAIERMLLREQFSLVGINKEIYDSWQELLRTLYPAKPVALDVIWVIERMRLRATGVDTPEVS